MIRTLAVAILAVSLIYGTDAVGQDAPAIVIIPVPQAPFIETTAFGQALNFDMRLRNAGSVPLHLRAIQMIVRNRAGAVVQVSEVNDNGGTPGIDAITGRDIAAGGASIVFNPFHTIAMGVEAATLDFHLSFTAPDGATSAADLRVSPLSYATKTALRLPLRGRVMIWDGHDFYSHHRRLDLDQVAELGVSANANRYSYDFVLVDSEGRRFRGDGQAFTDHFSFAQPVFAPGDGVVVAATDGMADGGELTQDMIRADLMNLFGNHIVIDHGNGEFSRLGHLKQGSVRVHVGQRVRAGDEIAAVGSSGSSLFPHLHYELARGADMTVEGLPSTFRNLDRVLGSRRQRMDGVSPDSGEIIADRAATVSP